MIANTSDLAIVTGTNKRNIHRFIKRNKYAVRETHRNPNGTVSSYDVSPWLRNLILDEYMAGHKELPKVNGIICTRKADIEINYIEPEPTNKEIKALLLEILDRLDKQS